MGTVLMFILFPSDSLGFLSDRFLSDKGEEYRIRSTVDISRVRVDRRILSDGEGGTGRRGGEGEKEKKEEEDRSRATVDISRGRVDRRREREGERRRSRAARRPSSAPRLQSFFFVFCLASSLQIFGELCDAERTGGFFPVALREAGPTDSAVPEF